MENKNIIDLAMRVLQQLKEHGLADTTIDYNLYASNRYAVSVLLMDIQSTALHLCSFILKIYRSK